MINYALFNEACLKTENFEVPFCQINKRSGRVLFIYFKVLLKVVVKCTCSSQPIWHPLRLNYAHGKIGFICLLTLLSGFSFREVCAKYKFGLFKLRTGSRKKIQA